MTPEAAAEAAEWLRAHDVYIVTPNPPGFWWVEHNGLRLQHTDQGLIGLAQARREYLAAGPDAWLEDTTD